MCPELDCAFKEQLDRVLRIAESADMGQVAAALTANTKPGGTRDAQDRNVALAGIR